MRLPPPRAQLAGCMWLARILEKARLMEAQTLPAEYAERFCHPTGVDSQFLRFFNLDKDALLKASQLEDSDFAQWFLRYPGVTPGKIEEWNHLATNLGRTGFPMAERLPVALSTTYSHLDPSGITSVFEAIEQDERQT